jgi:hypothetical protein
MKFDVIFGNPPFQDNKNKKKTQHKLWIDFTVNSVNQWLTEGGSLCWITPQSWGSPSNKVLDVFKKNDLVSINLDTKQYFPDIGSSFSHYLIKKEKNNINTDFIVNGKKFSFLLEEQVFYIPNDFCENSINIHKKVMFSDDNKIDLEHDYRTCHNVIRRAFINHDKKIDKKEKELKTLTDHQKILQCQEQIKKLKESRKGIVITVSEKKTNQHVYPILHTNKSIWYSSIKQDFADKKKVMWSRSGYTKPFYDDGMLGCTDMGYYVLVERKSEGEKLVKFLNSELMKYIFKTAKWSGFGNEKVFKSIPKINLPDTFDDDWIYDYFNINDEERQYIKSDSPSKKTKSTKTTSQTKNMQRVKNHGEVFTPLELVREMIKMVAEDVWSDNTKTFIDPACGNGNFLIEIFKKRIESNISPEKAAETIYGIDIMEDNVSEAKERIISYCRENNLYTDKLTDILNKNIVLSNALEKSMDEIFC